MIAANLFYNLLFIRFQNCAQFKSYEHFSNTNIEFISIIRCYTKIFKILIKSLIFTLNLKFENFLN